MASHQALVNLCWLGFAPNIIFAAITLVIAFFLPMTEESMKKVHAELELRRSSGQAQEGLAE
jgi:Na+/melibiose symporter-like transporter